MTMSDTNNYFGKFDDANTTTLGDNNTNTMNDIQNNTVMDDFPFSAAVTAAGLTNSSNAILNNNPLLSSINNSLNTNQLNNINNSLHGNNPFNTFAFAAAAAAAAGGGGGGVGNGRRSSGVGHFEPTPFSQLHQGQSQPFAALSHSLGSNLDGNGTTQQQQNQNNVVELLSQLVHGTNTAASSTSESFSNALSPSMGQTNPLADQLYSLNQEQQHQLLSARLNEGSASNSNNNATADLIRHLGSMVNTSNGSNSQTAFAAATPTTQPFSQQTTFADSLIEQYARQQQQQQDQQQQQQQLLAGTAAAFASGLNEKFQHQHQQEQLFGTSNQIDGSGGNSAFLKQLVGMLHNNRDGGSNNTSNNETSTTTAFDSLLGKNQAAVPTDATGIAHLLENNAWNTGGTNFANAMASIPGMPSSAPVQLSSAHPTRPPNDIQPSRTDDTNLSPEPTNTPSKRFNSWNERYNELVEFKRINGHCNVPSVYDENPALTQWVKRQRYQHTLKSSNKHSVLTPARFEMLERIGFTWSAHEASWEESYQHLVQFRRQYGHCRVPTRYPANQQLATWVKMQRRQFRLLKASSKKNGQRGTTTDDASSTGSNSSKEKSHMTWARVARLDDIGFEWDPRKLDKTKPSKN